MNLTETQLDPGKLEMDDSMHKLKEMYVARTEAYIEEKKTKEFFIEIHLDTEYVGGMIDNLTQRYLLSPAACKKLVLHLAEKGYTLDNDVTPEMREILQEYLHWLSRINPENAMDLEVVLGTYQKQVIAIQDYTMNAGTRAIA